MLVRSGALPRRRRLPLREQLPLLALPCGHRLRVQAVRRHRAPQLTGSRSSTTCLSSTNTRP